MRVLATAPGKLVLIGEYAVLEGAPALVMAVDRRARAVVEATGDAGARATGRTTHPAAVATPLSLQVRSLAPAAYEATGTLAPAGHLAWTAPGDAADRLSLAGTVFEALGPRLPARFSTLRATIETTEFFQQNEGFGTQKVGLGSSAAVTVVLAGALLALSGDPLERKREGLGTLLDLHRRFQSGRGSGIDLAASLHGGLLAYRLEDAAGGPPAGTACPAARSVALPPELHWCAVWTGRSAATGRYLAALEAWRARRATAYASHMRDLGAIARAGVAAVDAGNGPALLDCLGRFGSALRALGDDAGLDIVSAEHARLLACASEAGAVYKPCGAGGGDLGIALAPDPAALERFRRAAAREGFTPLPLALASAGLQLDTSLE